MKRSDLSEIVGSVIFLSLLSVLVFLILSFP
jgi:hypothetical protein